ncbi:MAG: dolichyl-phosphate beta-glucosyltransferase [Planctomycetota bacterium]
MPLEEAIKDQKPTLSIVIPAFNEARRIGTTLESIATYATRTHCELIVVDDGSSDETAEIVRRFVHASLEMHLLTNSANRGKGHAVRRGMLAATGDAVLMCDADLSTPIEELEKLRLWLARGYDVVIGSRDMPDSRLDPPQPILRRWMAWLFRGVRRRLMLKHVRDTQCGFKLFTRRAAREIFAQQTENGWLFDCEVLGLAERLGYRIKEAGVTWCNHPDTRVRPLRTALTALPRLLAIRRRLAETINHRGAEDAEKD